MPMGSLRRATAAFYRPAAPRRLGAISYAEASSMSGVVQHARQPSTHRWRAVVGARGALYGTQRAFDRLPMSFDDGPPLRP